MDLNEPLPTDSNERRRVQNRIAQRKFRQKQRAADRGRDRGYSQSNPSQTQQPSNISQSQQPLPLPPSCLNAPGTPNLDCLAYWVSDAETSIFPSVSGSSSSHPASLLSPPTVDLTLPSTTISLLSATDSLHRPEVLRDGMPVQNPQLQFTNAQLEAVTHYRSDGSIPDSSSTSASADGWLGTLHIAAEQGHDKIVHMLLKRNISFNDKDSDGRTPLMLAVIGGHEDVLKSLLAHGARIDGADKKGRSVLHWAVLQRQEAILRLLLEFSDAGRKLNIDYYDNVGWTALHCAVQRGFEAGTFLLLEAGANLHFRARRCPTTGNIIPPELL